MFTPYVILPNNGFRCLDSGRDCHAHLTGFAVNVLQPTDNSAEIHFGTAYA